MNALAVMAPQGRIRVWRVTARRAGRTLASLLTATFALFSAAVVAPGALATRAKTVTDRLVHLIATGCAGRRGRRHSDRGDCGRTRVACVADRERLRRRDPRTRSRVAGGGQWCPKRDARRRSAHRYDIARPETGAGASPYDPKAYPGLPAITRTTCRMTDTPAKGVGVALIDASVAPGARHRRGSVI
jgi:hypothetical protein